MPNPTLNQSSRGYVPIKYNFSYGDTLVDWGTKYLLSVSDVSCQSEPLDGKFTVSEMQVTFSDTNGSIWGSLGHGTACFGSSWTATAIIGGEMTPQTRGPNGAYRWVDPAGAGGYSRVLFSGRITDVRRVNRTVKISAKNVMSQVEDLEWEFPVKSTGLAEPFYFNRIGSHFFWAVSNLGTDSNYNPAFYNLNLNRDEWEFHAWLGPANDLAANYPTPVGRGTMGATTNFIYRGGSFRQEYERVHFKGTYLGTYIGTIYADETDKANSLGYSSTGAAEAAKVSGSLYPIGTTRVTCEGHTGDFQYGSRLVLEQAGITLGSTPAYLWYELLTGCCVTPLFATTLIDADTFATAARNVTFRSNSQRIPPKGGKVLPYIKDLLAPLQAQWAVSVQNKFKLFTYGPKILSDVVGTIEGSHIIESEVSASSDDVVNRVTLTYGYDYESGTYTKKVEKKGEGWGSSYDYPLILESKWISNTNEAVITVDKILKRNYKGIPRLQLKVPLEYMTGDIGSIYQVRDTDCLTGSKAYEVSAWRHNLNNERSVDLSMLDAYSFYKRGYAKWEGDGLLNKAVDSTSTSGWGTLGTTLGINETNYGTMFVWF